MLEPPSRNSDAKLTLPTPSLPNKNNDALPSDRHEVKKEYSGRNFSVYLTGWLAPSRENYGHGSIRIEATTTDGRPVARFDSGQDNLSPEAVRTILDVVESTLSPAAKLKRMVNYLVLTEGINFARHDCAGFLCESAEIPIARHSAPSLLDFSENPELIENQLCASSNKGTFGPENLAVEIHPTQGLLIAELSGKWEEDSPVTTCRFRVLSKAARSLTAEALRADLLRVARFLFDTFKHEGLIETASLLERGVIEADLLPCDGTTRHAETALLLNGDLPSRIAETHVVRSSDTIVKLAISESIAVITIGAPQWGLDRDLSSVIRFHSGDMNRPLSASQLAYIRQIHSMLCSERLSDRSQGVRMLFFEGRERLLEGEGTRKQMRRPDNPPRPLERSLRTMQITPVLSTPQIHLLLPKNILSTASRHKISARYEDLGTAPAMLDAVAGCLSRLYSQSAKENTFRYEIFNELKVTERFDGALWASTSNRFGSVIQGRLFATEALSDGDRHSLEADLLESFASQGTQGYTAFQEHLQRLIRGADTDSTDHEDLWDGTLTNLPSLTDAEAVAAMHLATKLNQRTALLRPCPSPHATCKYLGRGRVELCLLTHGEMGALALTLKGEQLISATISYRSLGSWSQEDRRSELIKAFATVTPPILSGERFSQFRRALEPFLLSGTDLYSKAEFKQWLERQSEILGFLEQHLGAVNVP